ncbi:MAG: DbpA RNA binding domain-containing protein, partial [Phenylobacterium sp.]|uniref:DbpA RNA binding domain-containing protein n=1 Tax=Phenylobacterium sp. TaxID=1871053 RepID=UPI0025D2A2CE
WLIPKICRAGGVTKRDIGAIRILDGETRFEIAREASPAFAAAIATPLPDGTRIAPSEAPGADARPPRHQRPRREFEPRGEEGSAPPRPKRAPRPAATETAAHSSPQPMEKPPFEKPPFQKKPFKKKPFPQADRAAVPPGDRPWKGKPRPAGSGPPPRTGPKRKPNDAPASRGAPYRGKPKRGA